ncbi:MAG: hypothetical protein ACKOUT_08170 [Novosphingobium sp.]
MTTPACAQDFALSVSPPRFELAAQPGQSVRAVAELSNASSFPTQIKFSTAEWELTPDGGVVLSNTLKPDSCRPWVAIERRQTTLQAKGQLRYRFEVTPPANAAPTECRFAIVVSGAEAKVSPGENFKFPISGEIAIIVYVAVGDVKPQLKIVKADVVTLNGVQTPVLMVENTGTAHGRLSAFLSGIDATGKKREFSPSTLPILPGETRRIALEIDDGSDAVEMKDRPAPPKAKVEPIVWPLKLNGTINDSVNTFTFEGVFEP